MSETWIDKSKWGDGPWQTEPDREEFRAHGLPCIVLRQSLGGNFCGYVGVAPGHPWHGKTYHDINPDVHGGLTFSEPCMEDDRPARERVCHVPLPGEAHEVWWLGFDCAHYMDFQPGRNNWLPKQFQSERNPDEHYRTLDYVKAECESLAKQAAAAAASPPAIGA